MLSTPMMHIARLHISRARETFWRTLQTFCITRIVIAFVLLAYIGLNAMKQSSPPEIVVDWRTCVVYVLFGIGFGLLSVYAQRRFMLHLMAQLMVDIGAISMLYFAAGGAKSGLAILYLFPLAGAAILAPLLLALFFVSVVALILLAQSGYELLHGSIDASPTQAGLYGAAFFLAIYVINRLAAKLIKQEALAAQRGSELQLQEAINRLVIADMNDGILVVGPGGEVFAINPAADRMLGLAVAPESPQLRLVEHASLKPIADAFFAWHGRPDGAGTIYVMVKPGDGARRDPRGVSELVTHLPLRFATVETPGAQGDRTVIFLQDVTEIENQAQQLKLASMGRLTASIAHEVRNPLSAISHATSLLSEDITQPVQLRLLNIVSDNVVRLNRMIEDILKLSRKAQTHDEPLRLASFLDEFVVEFRETHAVDPNMITVGPMGQYQLRFDPLHLREVLANLLSNAMRYASGGTGSVSIRARSPKPGRLELHVQDDGPAITAAVRAHLFEPFYTTSSKGTGLGLYVARELCLNNGAMLDYEYRTDMPGDTAGASSGRFVITFPMLDHPSLKKD